MTRIISPFATILFIGWLLPCVLSSCKSGGGEVMADSATFPGAEEAGKGIVILKEAFKSHDPRRVASQFSYPIQRKYPLRDIPDSAAMVKYYTTIVDDSLESIIVDTPLSDWHPVGWRGWTPTDDGASIWWDGKIYTVPYQSKKERRLREQIVKRDLETLEPDLQDGWIPFYCLVSPDTHTIYRIDIAEGATEEDSATLRLLAFPMKVERGMRPKMKLKGVMTVEGSAGSRMLHFSSDDDMYADYTMDISDDSTPTIVFSAKRDTSVYVVRPTYWLDFVTDSVSEQ